ncbi:unnamed protein product [Boreogadus saida]
MQSESGIVPDFEVGEEFQEEPKTYYELKSQPLKNSPSDQHGSTKPPLGSSAVTSRILLRQQLMREQLQEQERREHQRQQQRQHQRQQQHHQQHQQHQQLHQQRQQQQQQQALRYPQPGPAATSAQTPAIDVSTPASLPPAAPLPMEVLKPKGFRLCVQPPVDVHRDGGGPVQGTGSLCRVGQLAQGLLDTI